ncbi:MAG: CTB family bacteriocin [Dolichospermum sp.]
MSNLFTAVSVEQQAIVAGGVDGTINNTVFSGQQLLQTGNSISGFNGSATGGGQTSLRVNTAGQQININNAAAIVFPLLPFPQVQ